MLKRILALFCTLVLLTATAAGCSGSNEPSTPEDTASPQTTASKTKENFNEVGYPIVNEPITVTAMFATSDKAAGDPTGMSYWKKMEEVTNIHIDWKIIDSSEATAVQLFFAAGDFPDFISTDVDSSRQYAFGVEGGVFVDYSGLIDQYMPNMVSWFKEYPEAKKLITQINGAIYTLPRIQKASTSAVGQMFYRTDYLDNLKINAPATTEEFYNTLKTVKDAGLTKGFAPLLPYNAAHLFSQLEPYLFAAFGESTESDFADDGKGNVIYNRTSEQYKRYLEYMNRLFKEGLLENEVFTIDTATTLARIKTGQAAFMTYAANIMESDFPDGQIHLDCLAPLASEYTSTKKVKAYDFVSSGSCAINKKCKYVKELLRMFDINYAREEVIPGSGLYCLSQNLGLEGVDWEYTNSEKTAYRFILPDTWKESIWDYQAKYITWGQKYSAFVLMATSGSGNSLAREMGMMKNNIPYGVTQFPDNKMKYTTEEKSAMTNKINDINKFAVEVRAKFITGIEPISNWDAYVKQIEEMGIKDVLAIKQAAYDRWNSN